MGEGTVLTVVASLTGFLLYLQYALKEGLAKGQNWVESTELLGVGFHPRIICSCRSSSF